MILAPAWFFSTYLSKWAGSCMFPSLRPGKDHAHMGPKLLNHLKVNNFENKPDALGRRTATFYKNFVRQEMGIDMKPALVKKLETHGFKF
ncbi:MAG: hypothetical protein ACMG6E_07325 [Candidatus Roizmanbacteria bacterium]